MPSSPVPSDTPRVNLRIAREKQGLTTKDVHIRVGIPLEHIEALETGVVPKALRGKKLLRSKHAYLKYLGYPKHSKLDVRKRRPKRQSTIATARTGSTEIVPPTPSKSIITGFMIAIGMVTCLKTVALVFDDPEYSFDAMVDSMVERFNTPDPETLSPTNKLSNLPNETDMVSVSGALPGKMVKGASHESQDNIGSILNTFVSGDTTAEEEPTGPNGPNELHIRSNESTKVVFICDGHVVFRGSINRYERLHCNFSERAVIDAKNLGVLEVVHNDKKIQPMGPQGYSRRLTFLHKDF